jgi:Domain of unknown function (DUF3395)
MFPLMRPRYVARFKLDLLALSRPLQFGIQGFCDPAPFSHKELHVRYIFRSRMHYAEITDDFPVVLPLAGKKHDQHVQFQFTDTTAL